MNKLRLRFAKTDRAKYMSHLYLMRTFQRAFSRADIAIKYSEGFNPHPKISIVAPLSLGVESRCELLDFEAEGDFGPSEIERLNAALPGGIRAVSCAPPVNKPGELAWIGHIISFFYDNGVHEGSAEKIEKLFSGPVTVLKKTKRGESETDISPLVMDMTARQAGEDRIEICARLSFGESVLGPAYITAAVEKYLPGCAPDFAAYMRTETYLKNNLLFR